MAFDAAVDEAVNFLSLYCRVVVDIVFGVIDELMDGLDLLLAVFYRLDLG